MTEYRHCSFKPVDSGTGVAESVPSGVGIDEEVYDNMFQAATGQEDLQFGPWVNRVSDEVSFA